MASKGISMSTSQLTADIERRFGEMAVAVAAKDLDTLMSFYDDDLVLINGGAVLTKAELAESMAGTWAEMPDLALEAVSSHISGNVLAATLDASVGTGTEPDRIHWFILVMYTFDPTTLKVIRELAISDEEALAQRFAELGLA
jgi:ketosteroid isomerase-like protein